MVPSFHLHAKISRVSMVLWADLLFLVGGTPGPAWNNQVALGAISLKTVAQNSSLD